MTVLIIDTNLWVTASRPLDSHLSHECARNVLRFVIDLQNNDDHLAVDYSWQILDEYYREISEQDLAYEILALLAKQNRFDWTRIEIDSESNAIVRPECAIHDRSDRKFVAVSLAHEARPPIHNASDEDWLEDETILANCGIHVIHHCEAELRRRLKEKRNRAQL